MSNRYSDFEELRPTGEVSHTPDEKLTEGYDGEPRGQRVATSTERYPNEPTDAGGECQSCGVLIPTGQMKCRFCLINHLDEEVTRTDETAETTLLGIVYLVVESTSRCARHEETASRITNAES